MKYFFFQCIWAFLILPKLALPHKATVLEERGAYLQAQEYFQEAVLAGISPNFNHFTMKLGVTLYYNQNYPESIRWLQLVRHFSDNPLIYYYLARNYDLYYRDRVPALQHYQQFIDCARDNHPEQIAFSQKRIRALREEMHFAGE